MPTLIVQKITNSKPFKIYGMFCLVRGAIVAIATTCYIASGVANEARQSKHQYSNTSHTTNRPAPRKTEPSKANAYQCPYQSHFRNDDKSATRLY